MLGSNWDDQTSLVEFLDESSGDNPPILNFSIRTDLVTQRILGTSLTILS